MKKLFLFSIIGLLAGRLIAQQNIHSIDVGTNVPLIETKLKDVTGKEVSIKDAMNKNGVLVMFSCNTCPYVIKNQQRTKEVAAYALKNNIGVIVINSNEAQRNNEDSYAAMQKYAKDEGYNFSYVLDANSAIANAFGATRTPETFLVNSEGKIVYKGAIDDNPADAANVKKEFLKDAINETVKGAPVKVKESKSIGCGIKRVG